MQISYKYDVCKTVSSELFGASATLLCDRLTPMSQIHSLSLRTTYKLSIPRFRTSLFYRSFSNNTFVALSFLPDCLYHVSLNKLKMKLKRHYLQLGIGPCKLTMFTIVYKSSVRIAMLHFTLHAHYVRCYMF